MSKLTFHREIEYRKAMSKRKNAKESFAFNSLLNTVKIGRIEKKQRRKPAFQAFVVQDERIRDIRSNSKLLSAIDTLIKSLMPQEGLKASRFSVPAYLFARPLHADRTIEAFPRAALTSSLVSKRPDQLTNVLVNL